MNSRVLELFWWFMGANFWSRWRGSLRQLPKPWKFWSCPVEVFWFWRNINGVFMMSLMMMIDALLARQNDPYLIIFYFFTLILFTTLRSSTHNICRVPCIKYPPLDRNLIIPWSFHPCSCTQFVSVSQERHVSWNSVTEDAIFELKWEISPVTVPDHDIFYDDNLYRWWCPLKMHVLKTSTKHDRNTINLYVRIFVT